MQHSRYSKVGKRLSIEQCDREADTKAQVRGRDLVYVQSRVYVGRLRLDELVFGVNAKGESEERKRVSFGVRVLQRKSRVGKWLRRGSGASMMAPQCTSSA